MAILLGFFGSFHCVGMCGPIAMTLPVHNKPLLIKYSLILLYNLGRITTYCVLGLVAGIIGKSFLIGGFQQTLSISIGVLLLIYVFVPLKNTSTGYLFFLSIKTSFERLFSKGTRSSLFFIGVLNGLLPCGLVYVGLAGATATSDYLKGLLFMAGFGVGTIPTMLLIPLASGFITVSIRNKMRKVVPIITTVMALFLILRGFNLGIPYLSPKMNEFSSSVSCHLPHNAYNPEIIKCPVPSKK